MDSIDVTRLLDAYGSGDRSALDQLLPLLYADLQGIARHHLAGEGSGRPFDTTGLVHEAYLRLVGVTATSVTSRSHFLSLAARTMRRVLTDGARRRNALKRGGTQEPVTLNSEALGVPDRAGDLLDLDRALAKLESLDSRQSRVVECKVFAGMAYPEIAQALDISVATVKRDWGTARAWLNRELSR
jgi:RNA polymerase sigma factor (TIGR02999 family)